MPRCRKLFHPAAVRKRECPANAGSAPPKTGLEASGRDYAARRSDSFAAGKFRSLRFSCSADMVPPFVTALQDKNARTHRACEMPPAPSLVLRLVVRKPP